MTTIVNVHQARPEIVSPVTKYQASQSNELFLHLGILQLFRITQVLGFGGGSAAVFANIFGVADKFFVFLEIVFYKAHIIRHAKMGFVPGMGLGDLQIQWKPF